MSKEDRQSEDHSQLEAELESRFKELGVGGDGMMTTTADDDDGVFEEDEFSASGHEENLHSDDGDEGLDDDNSDDTVEGAVDSDESSTLPPEYVRSLRGKGWTPEEIESNYNELGDAFLKVAKTIHESRNQETAAWAEHGRRIKATGQQPATPPDSQGQPAPHAPPQQDQGLPTQLNRVDTNQLKQRFGDDEMVDTFATEMNTVIDQINKVLPVIGAMSETTQQSREQTLREQVNQFFESPETSKVGLYGSVEKGLGPQEVEFRDKVLETADALIYGSAAQNRPVTLEQALHDAHDLVSASVQKDQALKSVHRVAKQRNRGITNKPSSRRAPQKQSKKSSDDELVSKTADRINTILGRN